MDVYGLVRSLNAPTNLNFTLKVRNFRRTFGQHSGGIVFARKTIGVGGTSVVDGWEKAEKEEARSAGRLRQ